MNALLFEKLTNSSKVTTGGLVGLLNAREAMSDEQFYTLLMMCVVHVRHDKLALFHVDKYASVMFSNDLDWYDPEKDFCHS